MQNVLWSKNPEHIKKSFVINLFKDDFSFKLFKKLRFLKELINNNSFKIYLRHFTTDNWTKINKDKINQICNLFTSRLWDKQDSDFGKYTKDFFIENIDFSSGVLFEPKFHNKEVWRIIIDSLSTIEWFEMHSDIDENETAYSTMYEYIQEIIEKILEYMDPEWNEELKTKIKAALIKLLQ